VETWTHQVTVEVAQEVFKIKLWHDRGQHLEPNKEKLQLLSKYFLLFFSPFFE
jgi:hypothetical protein